MPKSKQKAIALNSDVLSRYVQLGNQAAAVKKERDQLRRQIIEALKLKRKPAPGFNVQLQVVQRPSIPWQAEAERWKAIALGFADELGKSAKAKAKLEVVYPEMPVETLTIRLAGNTSGEEE